MITEVDKFLKIALVYDRAWYLYMMTLSEIERIGYAHRLIDIYENERNNRKVRGHAEAMYLSFFYGVDVIFRQNPKSILFREELSKEKNESI